MLKDGRSSSRLFFPIGNFDSLKDQFRRGFGRSVKQTLKFVGKIGIGRRNFQILAASFFTGVETFSLLNLHLAHQTAVVVV